MKENLYMHAVCSSSLSRDRRTASPPS